MLTFLRAVHFWILENQELKVPVDSSSEAAFCAPSWKSIIFRYEAAARTSELDVQHGWKERFAQLQYTITMNMEHAIGTLWILLLC